MLHALRPHLIAFVVLRLYAAADLSFSLALSVCVKVRCAPLCRNVKCAINTK